MTRYHESLSYNIVRAENIVDMYKRSALSYEDAVKRIERLMLPEEFKSMFIKRLDDYRKLRENHESK